MVLQDLGEKILAGFNKLANAKNVDEQFFKEFVLEITKSLQEADVSKKTVLEFAMNLKKRIDLKEAAPGVSMKKRIQSEVLNELVEMIDPGTEPFKPIKKRPNVFMMVGLQGAGKTTTCAKLANWYKKRGWKVGLVGADTFRAGAREQLMQNAQRVGVPYYVDLVNPDPVSVAVAGVSNFKRDGYDMIIVDTSGKHSQEGALFEEMQEMEAAISPDEVIFVMDGTIGQAAYDQATAFAKSVSIGSIIITKLDSGAKGGGALSAVAATQCPISFYGVGEEADQLEVFDPKSFISRMLGFGDAVAFAHKLETLDMKKQEDIARRIVEGKFGFREMYEQFEQIQNMGSISGLFDMMGLSKMIPGNLSDEETSGMIKKFLVIIDSMSDEEMDNPQLMRDEKRVRRLVRGTGLPIEMVKAVIENQKQMAKVFSRMPKDVLKHLTASSQPKGMNEKLLKADINKLVGAMSKGNMPRGAQQMMNPAALQQMMKMGWGGK